MNGYKCECCGEISSDSHEGPYDCVVYLRRRIDFIQNMVEKQAYAIDKLKVITGCG